MVDNRPLYPVKNYQVVVGVTLNELEVTVSRELLNGWQLHEGLIVSIQNGHVWYYQVLVKLQE